MIVGIWAVWRGIELGVEGKLMSYRRTRGDRNRMNKRAYKVRRGFSGEGEEVIEMLDGTRYWVKGNGERRKVRGARDE